MCTAFHVKKSHQSLSLQKMQCSITRATLQLLSPSNERYSYVFDAIRPCRTPLESSRQWLSNGVRHGPVAQPVLELFRKNHSKSRKCRFFCTLGPVSVPRCSFLPFFGLYLDSQIVDDHFEPKMKSVGQIYQELCSCELESLTNFQLFYIKIRTPYNCLC